MFLSCSNLHDGVMKTTNVQVYFFKYDLQEDILYGNGRDDGKWGDWSNKCPLNSGICGFETRFEGPDAFSNSGVNDIVFYCCND